MLGVVIAHPFLKRRDDARLASGLAARRPRN